MGVGEASPSSRPRCPAGGTVAPGTVRPRTARVWHRVPVPVPSPPPPPAFGSGIPGAAGRDLRRSGGGGERRGEAGGGSASAGSRRQPGRVAGEKGCDEIAILSNMTSSLPPRTGSRVPAGRGGPGCGEGKGCRREDAGGPGAAASPLPEEGSAPPGVMGKGGHGASHHPALLPLPKPLLQSGEGRSSGVPFCTALSPSPDFPGDLQRR